MNVSVFGLGKLGAPLLAVLSSQHDVIGVDTNAATVSLLNQGKAPVSEPGLQKLLTENREHYLATTEPELAAETDVSFVITPTNSNADGDFSNHYVISAVEAIGKAIKAKKGYHLVVIVSTVMPGATLGPIAKALEMKSFKTIGKYLGLCYAPEFIALGSVIHDLTHPDMLLIGQCDDKAGSLLQEVNLSVVKNDPEVIRLTVVEAEIAKLCLNAAITMKISFANQLAELCEGIQGADAFNVARAIGSDSRIGSKYIQPATSFAGPCFPRDNQALMAFARQSKAIVPLAEATVAVNDRQVDRLANIVESLVPEDTRVAILGTAYKPNTPVVDLSVGIQIAGELERRGYDVIVHDPVAMAATKERLSDKVSYAANIDEALNAEAIVIATPHNMYKSLGKRLDDKRVFDLWRLYPKRDFYRPGIFQWGVKS